MTFIFFTGVNYHTFFFHITITNQIKAKVSACEFFLSSPINNLIVNTVTYNHAIE